MTTPAPDITVAADADALFRAAASVFQRVVPRRWRRADRSRWRSRAAPRRGASIRCSQPTRGCDRGSPGIGARFSGATNGMCLQTTRRATTGWPRRMLSRVPVRADRVHRVRAEQPDAEVAASLTKSSMHRTFRFLWRDSPVRPDPARSGRRRSHRIAFSGHAGARGTLATGHGQSRRGARCRSHHDDLSVAERRPAVMFVVAGSEKAAAVRAVLQPDPGTPELPARLVQPEEGAWCGCSIAQQRGSSSPWPKVPRLPRLPKLNGRVLANRKRGKKWRLFNFGTSG